MQFKSDLPCFVFLESNTTGTGALFVSAAQAEGCYPILLAQNPNLYPYALEQDVAVLQVNTSDFDDVLRVCTSINAQKKILGVMSTSDYYLVLAARIACHLGVASPNMASIARCRNKKSQYDALRQSSIEVPQSWIVHNIEELQLLRDVLRFPAVAKPVEGSGSVGVKLCESFLALIEHAEVLLSATTNDRGLVVNPAVLIQSYVDGPEYSIECMEGEVVGITRKYLSPPPYFVEMGHDFPAVLTADLQMEIEAATKSILSALDLMWGAVHLEMRISNRGPCVIEVNPRLAGGFIPELVRRAYGIDLIRGLVRRHLGRPSHSAPTDQRFSAIRFLTPASNGILEAVSGIAEAQSVVGVEDVRVYRSAGSVINLRGSFHDRIAHVITEAKTKEDCLVSANKAIELLSVEISPL